MQYKKTLCIFLAAVFLLTAASGAVAQERTTRRIGPGEGLEKQIAGTGTVLKSDLRENYIIETDEEIKIMGLSFDKLYPINQETVESFEDQEVEYEGYFSIFMNPRIFLICIFLQALPVHITTIKPIEQPEDSIIEGHVYDADENPITGASVAAKPNGNTLSKIHMTDTDQNGYYKLEVKSGEYKVTASKDGYSSETKDADVAAEETVTVDFTLSAYETVVLTLDTLPEEVPLRVFSLSPEPIELNPTTNGKLHAVYEKDTNVYVRVHDEEAQNYAFDHWTGDASGEDNPLSIVLDDDKEIIANFVDDTPELCKLTITVDGPGTTNPAPGEHIYPKGSEVRVYAVEKDSEFQGWDGDASGDDNPITVLMNDDKAVIAVFEDQGGDIEPPEVETLPAEVNDKVVLSGKILDDGGEACEAWFEIRAGGVMQKRIPVPGLYRTDDTFSKTIDIPDGISSSGQSVYYRACAVNSAGEGQGDLEEIILKP